MSRSLRCMHIIFARTKPSGRSWSYVQARCVSTQSNVNFPNVSVFNDVPELRQFRNAIRSQDRSVGLVPTMGALHDGHLSLIRQAAEENTDIVVSVYVNPTQFGVTEDLSTYPRTWDADMAALSSLDQQLEQEKLKGRITAIFAPSTDVMYPTLAPSSEIEGDGSFVTITPLARILEGKSRPVFFRGVATVCMKLFNIVQPDRVYFGQKDIQQTAVLRRMIKDFHLPLEFCIGCTIREQDGLAMSSRNVYLGSRRRKAALALSESLKLAESLYDRGQLSRDAIQGSAMQLLEARIVEQKALAPDKRALFVPDYMSLADPDTLEELEQVDPAKGAVLSGAILMQPLEETGDVDEVMGMGGDTGVVRLIDNIVLPPR